MIDSELWWMLAKRSVGHGKVRKLSPSYMSCWHRAFELQIRSNCSRNLRMKIVISLLVLVTLTSFTWGEEENCAEYFEGCNISKGKCLCGETRGCKNTYPYRSLKECEQELEGLNDPCAHNKCSPGICVQIKRNELRSYKCECSGTSCFGVHCQHKCNELTEGQEGYPAECVF